MSKIKLLSLAIILLIFSCKKEEELAPINNNTDTTAGLLLADFSYEVIVKENQPDVYMFKNKSKNAKSFKWYFGNFDSSTVLDPSITFPTQDFYIVRLVVSDGKESKMKAFRIEVKDLNPGAEPTNNKLDFKVNINCDSSTLFKCINLSDGYSDFKWTFNDGTESTEINPEHLFTNTSTSQKVITLTAKDLSGNTKSITRSFNTGYATFKIERCAVILINQNPIRYRFYEDKSSYEDLSIDYITYFNGSTTDTIQYENANTELELASYQGINTFKFHVENPNNSSNLTVYKTVKTPDINNTINKISRLNGLADFTERYMLEEMSYTPPRKTVYNDTTLNLTLNNGINVNIIDTTLHHSFTGYPAYWSFSSINDSNIVNFVDYKINSVNPFINASVQIKFNTINDDINASYYYFQSGKISLKTELIYNGRLR